MSGTAVLITPEPIGTQMAGPAIRMYELARVVATEMPVLLVSLSAVDLPGADVPLAAASTRALLQPMIEGARSLTIQGDVLGIHPWLADLEVPIIVDVYDPFHLEQLQPTAARSESQRRVVVRDCVRALNTQLARADLVLCASSRQRSLWLGHLASLGRVNPATYDQSPDLAQLIAVVPFGAGEAPEVTGEAVRAELGIGADSPIALWGGGVYPWFDLQLLVEAMARIQDELPEARLVVLGGGHPVQGDNPDDTRNRAKTQAAALGVLDRTVIFPDRWVPYAERHQWLAAADIGVSVHLDHLETEFSFRTRCLDYLAAGLPIITSGGDAVADLVTDSSCGAVVPPGDLDALADVLRQAFTDTDWRRDAALAARRVAEDYRWERVAAPLVAFCRDPHRAPDLIESQAQRALLGVSGPARTGLRSRVAGVLAEGGPALLAQRALARPRRLVVRLISRGR